jgi:hypothetical protein
MIEQFFTYFTYFLIILTALGLFISAWIELLVVTTLIWCTVGSYYLTTGVTPHWNEMAKAGLCVSNVILSCGILMALCKLQCWWEGYKR